MQQVMMTDLTTQTIDTMIEKTVYPIAENYELHFHVDPLDKCICVKIYDNINRTTSALVQWQRGHWIYHNPVQWDRFSSLCREYVELYPIVRQYMAYLRNPYKYDGMQDLSYVVGPHKGFLVDNSNME